MYFKSIERFNTFGIPIVSTLKLDTRTRYETSNHVESVCVAHLYLSAEIGRCQNVALRNQAR